MKAIALILCMWLVMGARPTVQAEIRLPALISSNMVLQQRTDAPLWGWARARSAVSVTTSWDKKQYATKADAQGRWQVAVATPAAGGPYCLTFSDGETLRIDNVLVGEVWVCSGQSNMGMPMRGFNSQPVLNANAIIAASENPSLRLFNVSQAASLVPLADCKGQWKSATPATVREFSAVAYQFGQMLQQQLKVPVGLVLAAVGGTRIESWMSQSSLRAFPKVYAPASLDTAKAPHKEASPLFNGMIAPLVTYVIRGFIWYQGESNRHVQEADAQAGASGRKALLHRRLEVLQEAHTA